MSIDTSAPPPPRSANAEAFIKGLESEAARQQNAEARETGARLLKHLCPENPTQEEINDTIGAILAAAIVKVEEITKCSQMAAGAAARALRLQQAAITRLEARLETLLAAKP